MKLQVGRGWSSACMQPLWGYSLALLPAEKPDSCWRRMFNLASIERHANTKHFSLWKTFQEKIFCISISTAKKNFCQVMNLLMSQERCSASLDRNDSKRKSSAQLAVRFPLQKNSRRLHASIPDFELPQATD